MKKTRSKKNLVTLSLEMNEYMNILPISQLSLPLMGCVLPRVRWSCDCWPIKIDGFMYSGLCPFFPTHQLLCPSSTLQCVGCPEPLLNALQLFPFRTGPSNVSSGNCALRNTAKNHIFPEKELRGHPQSQLPHSCVCERFLHSQDQSAYSAAGNMWTDPGKI